jgi:hypothetical protein
MHTVQEKVVGVFVRFSCAASLDKVSVISSFIFVTSDSDAWALLRDFAWPSAAALSECFAPIFIVVADMGIMRRGIAPCRMSVSSQGH